MRGHSSWIRNVALTPDGCSAVSASYDHTARVWDLQSNTLRSVLRGHSDVLNSCAISADGEVAVTACSDGAVRIWNTYSGRQLYELRMEGFDFAYGSAVTADGRMLAASFCSTMNKGVVVVCDRRGGGLVKAWNVDVRVYTVVMSADARVIAYVWRYSDGRWGVDTVDGATGAQLRSVSAESRYLPGVAMDAVGKSVVVADDSQLRVTPAFAGGERPLALPGYTATGYSCHCAISRNGRRVVAAVAGGKYNVWDVKECAIVAVLHGYASVSRACDISDKPSRVLTAGIDRAARVWSLPRRSPSTHGGLLRRARSLRGSKDFSS